MKLSLKQRMLQLKKYAAIILFFLLLSGCFNMLSLLLPSKSYYPETLQQELERIKKEKEDTRKKIEEAKKAETDYMKQVDDIENNLVEALAQLDELDKEFKESKSNLDKSTIELVIKNTELSELEKELNEKVEILNTRIASIYKNKNYKVIDLIFGTNSFLKILSKFKFMTLLAKQDIQIMSEVKEKRDETAEVKKNIENLKNKQEIQKQKFERLVGKAEEKEYQIEGIYNEKKTLLGKTRANKNVLISMENQLDSKEAEITKKLESLRYGIAPGILLFPIKGIISSNYGNRLSPITGTMRFHAGVDVADNSGTPIRAAAGGEILQAGYMTGYGYAILIYHGGGVATFYGHMSGFAVKQGQQVKKGQIIGYVGSTGWSTGPHLHFEIRINGAPVNPLNFF